MDVTFYINDDGEITQHQGHHIRTRFNYIRDTRHSALRHFEPTRTQQHMKEETDINTIVKNFAKTGQTPMNINTPMQGDFSDAPDYQTALNLLIQAEQEFMRLPAETRERFGNDPGRFIAFAEDPANLDEARKMGLARAQVPAPGPISVRVVPDAQDT